MIDRDLVRAINRGTAFALVGSGPSCELGMPSWHTLAQEVASAFQDQLPLEKANAYLSKKQYPELFGLAVRKVGRNEVLAVLRQNLSEHLPVGETYRLLSRWPIQAYLTTNYDDALLHHLQAEGVTAVTRRNSRDDLSLLHSRCSDIVFKIHGDLSDPDNLVLTDDQYEEFRTHPKREYWKKAIFALLRMVDVVVIGYSLSDPDFNQALEGLKESAAPDHPVFLFACNERVEREAARDFYLKRNIRVIPYDNEDGQHMDLARVLARYDHFIARRGPSHVGLPEVDLDQAIIASSLYLFTRLRLDDTQTTCIKKAYAALIMTILTQAAEAGSSSLPLIQVADDMRRRTHAAVGVDPQAMNTALSYLHGLGYVEIKGDVVSATSYGRSCMRSSRNEEKLRREKFLDWCRNFLRRNHSALGDEQVQQVLSVFSDALLQAFLTRGLEIARFIYTGTPITKADATDILDMINERGATLKEQSCRAGFTELLLAVLESSHDAVKNHLATLCQGYFAYHALGLEPRGAEARLAEAKQKVWILDSSIIIPLLAVDCGNSTFASDLLDRMARLGLEAATTESLFTEVVDHAWWVVRNFENVSPHSPEFLLAASAKAGYRPNLFLDGFTKWQRRQANPTLHRYMGECLGPDYQRDLTGAVRKRLEDRSISVKRFEDWPGFHEEMWVARDEELADRIRKSREARGTYTGPNQVKAEAEAVLLCGSQDAAFVSQSGFLNSIGTSRMVCWKPQTMYQFLTMFSTVPASEDLLHQCVMHEFLSSGFDIVDSASLAELASPQIHQARMTIEQERSTYSEAIGQDRFKELEEGFENTPDEVKPFYAQQFAFYVAGQEATLRQAAERRAHVAEQAGSLKEKERREYQQLKAKKEEKLAKQRQKKRASRSRRKRKGRGN